jgi:hypothetical protein
MNPGDKVRFTSAGAHERYPWFYPAPGTVGTVDRIAEDHNIWVRWPDGSTYAPYLWCCSKYHVEVVEE